MKEKRIIAMFVTSIVAFVASLTISVGVALALADPVAAVGLAEVKFNISSANKTYENIVFDPSCAFNGNIEDALEVNNYEEIFYSDEAYVEQIKLLKVSVTNDTSVSKTFTLKINTTSNNDATTYSQFAIYDIDTTIYPTTIDENRNPNYWRWSAFDEFGKIAQSNITLAAGETRHFVIAAYVSDKTATKLVEVGGAGNQIYTNISLIVDAN